MEMKIAGVNDSTSQNFDADVGLQTSTRQTRRTRYATLHFNCNLHCGAVHFIVQLIHDPDKSASRYYAF